MMASPRARLLLGLLLPPSGGRALELMTGLERTVRRRAPICTAVAPPPQKPERKFLVNNDRNDVQVLQCVNEQMVEQGLLELGALPHS